MPVRVQRKRTAGWRMPDATIYVGRPTIWGNPFTVGDLFTNRTWAWNRPEPGATRPAGSYDHAAAFGDDAWTEIVAEVADRAHAVDLFRAYITVENVGQWDPANIRFQLGDSDLCCWCPLDKPCHADVLLEIANGGVR
jgi:hypothetical protein